MFTFLLPTLIFVSSSTSPIPYPLNYLPAHRIIYFYCSELKCDGVPTRKHWNQNTSQWTSFYRSRSDFSFVYLSFFLHLNHVTSDSLFAYRVQTVQIPQQQQCFPEGCFSLFNFRVTGFRQPRVITLKSLTPNFLFINVMMFDLDIVGTVSGNIQIVLSVPVSGGIVISTKGLSISATLDLQKNQYRQPYLRVAGCELRGGFYDAKVTDLGLLTDSINAKYRQEMIGKAREVIQTTICSNLEMIVKSQVNIRLTEVPRSISVARVLEFLDSEVVSSIVIKQVHHFEYCMSFF